MKKYICKSCGYSVTKETMPRSCNYCGKVGSMVQEESVENILDEIDNL